MARLVSPFKAYSTSASALQTVQATVLDNGITVISEDNGSALTTVSVVVAAGSRYETAATAGAASLVETMAYQSTVNRSGLWITRETEAAGAQLSSSFDRENISYTAKFLRGEYNLVMDNLSDAVTGQLFMSHEVDRCVPFAQKKNAAASSKNAVVNTLVENAFRAGLERPAAPFPENVSRLTSETLQGYTKALFTGDRIAVVGHGISHADLVAKVKRNFAGVAKTGAARAPAAYSAGSSRIRSGAADATIAIGYQGVSISDKNALAVRVLSNIVGPTSRFPSAPSSTGHAFSLNFSDTGLFGFFVNGKCVDGITRNVKNAQALLAGGFSPAALEAAKAAVQTTLTEQCPAQRIQGYAAQALGKAAIVSPEAQLEALAGLTAADVSAAAAAVLKSKPTVVALGNLDICPYEF